MDTLPEIVERFTDLSVQHLNTMIALGGLIVACFAIYAVMQIARRK